MAVKHHHHHHLLLLLLVVSAAAQYSFDDQDGGAGDYISATPESSPAAAPGPAGYFDEDLSGSGGGAEESGADSSATPAAKDSSASAAAAAGDSSAAPAAGKSSATQTATLDTLTGGGITYNVPVSQQASVNTFVQSTMQVSAAKTDNFIENVIEKRLSDPNLDTYSKDCLNLCKEVYEDSVGAMKKTLEDINDNNYFKANVDVSAMSNDADTCKECIKQVYGQDPEFEKFNKWIDGIIDQCLTKITGASGGSA